MSRHDKMGLLEFIYQEIIQARDVDLYYPAPEEEE
jgi:hypothetical protein